MKKIEIYDRDKGGALAFQLSEVLLSLPPDARFPEWRILELEAVGPDVLVLEENVKTSEYGLKLSWVELISLAESLEQIINLKFCGYFGESQQDRISDKSEVQLTIEVADSTYWIVTTNLQSVLSWVRHNFKEIQEVKLPSASE